MIRSNLHKSKSSQFILTENEVVTNTLIEHAMLKKVLKIKRHLNFVNWSYLFTHISYLEKTYTTTAQEPSIYRQSPVKPPDIKNIIVVTLTFLYKSVSCNYTKSFKE